MTNNLSAGKQSGSFSGGEDAKQMLDKRCGMGRRMSVARMIFFLFFGHCTCALKAEIKEVKRVKE